MKMSARHAARISAIPLVLSALVISPACGSSSVTTSTSPTALTRCSVTATGTYAVPAQGGGGAVAVSAARECSWSVSLDCQWLSIKTGSTGQGEGSVEYAAVANPDPVTRKGALLLNEQRFEVTQAAGECVVSLAEISATFAQTGGSGHLDVRASSAMCTWTAASETPWIVLRGETSGKGSAQIAFDVLPAAGPLPTGSIPVAGQRFSVTQAEGCAYAIAPAAATAAAVGANGAIAVTAGPG